MADKYIGFTYNNQNSITNHKTYIVNEGADLTFFNAPSFSNEYAFPKFGENSVLLGVNKENRILSYRLFVKEITLTDYRNLLNWLRPDGVKKQLSFDYDEYFAYWVVVESISEGKFTVNKNCDPNNPTYNIDLDISFSTVGDYAATIKDQEIIWFNNVSLSSSGITIGNNNAVIRYFDIGKYIYIENNTNEKMYFNLYLKNQTGNSVLILIKDFAFNVSNNKILEFYSKFAIAIETDINNINDENNNFIAYDEDYNRPSIIVVNPKAIVNIDFDYTVLSANNVGILPIVREVI